MRKRLFKVGGKLCTVKNGKVVPIAVDGRYVGAQQFGNKVTNDMSGKFGLPEVSTGAKQGECVNGYDTVTGLPCKKKEPAFGWQDGVKAVGQAAAFADSMRKNQYDPSNTYTAAATAGYNDDSVNQGIVKAAGAIPVYGPLINAFQSIGTAASNAIKDKDEHGISKSKSAETFGNIIHPGEHIGQSVEIGKKYGDKAGWKNFLTAGVSGRELMKQAVSKGEDFDDFMKSRQSTTDESNYRTDSIYAKYGKTIKTTHKNLKKGDPNVEIEDGEIVLFPDANPNSVSILGKGGSTHVSRFAARFKGDKHGQDSDNDGMEGINLIAQEGSYVGSNYLGVDGKKAKKGKTVADSMMPSVEYLHNAEINKQDKYQNNDIAINHHLNMLKGIKQEAERNKFKEELKTKIKDKNADLTDVLTHLNNAPMEDLKPEEQTLVNDMNNRMRKAMMEMGGKMNMNEKSLKRLMQMGGETQQAPQSSDRMNQLEQQAMQMGAGQAQVNPNQVNLSPDAQEILSQLPPEIQQEIMNLPPDQQEAAIMQAASMMQQEQQQMPQPMEQPQPSEVPAEVMQMLGGGTVNESTEKSRLMKKYLAKGYSKEASENMVKNKMNEFQPRGGQTHRETLKQGMKVRFKRGGKVYEGTVKQVGDNGSFSIM